MQLSLFKQCPKCGKTKFVTAFYKNKSRKDGLATACKSCHDAMSKKWIDENIDYKRSRVAKKRRDERPHYRELEKHYWDNAPDDKKEAKLNRVRVWRKSNRDKCNQYSRNRASWMKGGDGKITVSEFSALCERYGNVCLCCKRSDVELTIDHVVPLSKGGSNTIDNVQPLCRTCNSRKNNKTIDYR